MCRTVVFKPQTGIRSDNSFHFCPDCLKRPQRCKTNRIHTNRIRHCDGGQLSHNFQQSQLFADHVFDAYRFQFTAGRRAGEAAGATGTVRPAHAVRPHASYKFYRPAARERCGVSTAAQRSICSVSATRWFASGLTGITYDVFASRNRRPPALCSLGAKLLVIRLRNLAITQPVNCKTLTDLTQAAVVLGRVISEITKLCKLKWKFFKPDASSKSHSALSLKSGIVDRFQSLKFKNVWWIQHSASGK